MSNRTRRLLAITVCVTLGTLALLDGLRRLSNAGSSHTALGVVLLATSLFFLLSAVGLLKPWLPKPPVRPR